MLKLPVHPAVYEALRHVSGVADLIEPDNLTQAWTLSIAVSSTLHPSTQLHAQLDDELSVAGEQQPSLVPILLLCLTGLLGPPC